MSRVKQTPLRNLLGVVIERISLEAEGKDPVGVAAQIQLLESVDEALEVLGYTKIGRPKKRRARGAA